MAQFYESQRFSNPILLVVIYLFLIGSMGSIIVLYFTDYWSELHSEDRTGIFITALTLLPISLLFLFSKLETKIDEIGVHVRFRPLMFKFRTYAWQDIEKAYCKKYSPLLDFGGWGYRIGIMGQGHAYMISGNEGLQLELKNGKKRLIGTHKSNEIESILKDYLQPFNN